jgi:acetyl esterase
MSAQPTLDPQFVPFLQALASLPPLWSQSVQDVRKMWDLSVYGRPEEVGAVRELTIPVADGTIAARLYTPKIAPTALLVFYHGGGWVVGSLETHDLPLRALTNLAGVAILSVDYRLAPEHPFPAAVDDCLAATRYVAEHATELKVRGIAVGGDSAGGNLAAVVSLLARDAGSPALAFQLLIYPATDQRCATASHERNAQGYLLTRDAIQYFRRNYLPNERDWSDWRASPLLAQRHADLPAALVITAGYDPLVDEGRAYAEKLRAAGVAVECRDYADMVHGFVLFGGVLDTANVAVADCCAALRRAFEKVPA